MTTRVVIVGGGVIGMMCAVRLAVRGARVDLLESEPENYSARGPAASLAAAGMLAPIGEAPPDGHKEYARLALESYELWRTWRAGAIWADALSFDGSIILAENAAHADAILAAAAALKRNAKRLSPSQFRKRSNLDVNVSNAIYVADEGVADPGRALSGLAMEARKHGAVIHYNCEVDRIETGPMRAHTLDSRVFEADRILFAPGIWTIERFADVAPALRRLRPAKGHMVPVMLGQPLGATLRGDGFYVARRGQEHVLGATMEWDRLDGRVDEAKVAELLSAAERTLPGAIRRDPEELPWAGVRPMSPDGAPMIGPSGDVLVAAGHSRNGWLLAPITAEIVAAQIFGEETPEHWRAFSPDRIEEDELQL